MCVDLDLRRNGSETDADAFVRDIYRELCSIKLHIVCLDEHA